MHNLAVFWFLLSACSAVQGQIFFCLASTCPPGSLPILPKGCVMWGTHCALLTLHVFPATWSGESFVTSLSIHLP